MSIEKVQTEKPIKAFRYKRPLAVIAERLCLRCSVPLSSENWSKSMQKYKRYICKTCWNARQNEYGANEAIEVRRARAKAWRENMSPERKIKERRRQYNTWLIKTYNITLKDYEKMLLDQNSRCFICFTDAPRGRGAFHVDHCHLTNKVRKLLCAECNMMIGLAKDNPETLRFAAEYLELHI